MNPVPKAETRVPPDHEPKSGVILLKLSTFKNSNRPKPVSGRIKSLPFKLTENSVRPGGLEGVIQRIAVEDIHKAATGFERPNLQLNRVVSRNPWPNMVTISPPTSDTLIGFILVRCTSS